MSFEKVTKAYLEKFQENCEIVGEVVDSSENCAIIKNGQQSIGKIVVIKQYMRVSK